MKERINKRFMQYRILLLYVVLILGLFVTGFASADDTADAEFTALVEQLMQDGIIPESDGTYLTFNDYEDTYANMDYYRTIPLTEAGHFVISVDLSWTSANKTPNTMTSGCGVMFNGASGSSDMLMASLLMDGSLYLYGSKNNNPLYYGKTFYTNPSVAGGGRLVLAADGENVNIFVDGAPVMTRTSLAVMGETVGFTILSGTYQGYGIRCRYDNIHFYIWE